MNYWKDRKVLITGYEGFLGSNLTRRLVASGAVITGLDIKVNRRETLLTNDDYKKISVIKGSVADYHLVKDTIRQRKIEYVFHLAAEALVGRCLKDPLRGFSTNTCGTWNILEACRDYGRVRAIIVASSDKAYGSAKKLPYRENTPLAGDHPYDVSKSCADLIAHTYFNTYGLPVAITRCGNIYGPGDFNFSRLIPDAIRCMLAGRVFNIRSDGKFIRDYIYVDDVVDGYLALARKFAAKRLAGEAFNFSNERPLSVLAVIKEIYRIHGAPANYKILDQAQCEIKRQYLCSQKARTILKWSPAHDIQEGLRKTIRAYKKWLDL